MAAFSRKLEVIITGSDRDLASTLRSASGHVGTFAGKFRNFAAGMVTGMAGAFAVDRILNFAGAMNRLGTSMLVAGIKTDTVFGESAGMVREWADDLNEALGISDEALTGLAANMGDLLKPMGFTSAEAAEMSTEMLDLAGALSAWSGGTRSSAEVAEILQSALLGETDQLKGLGISISAADVAARVAAKGQDELTGAALQQAEAIAIQELMLEKSTDAQEAWANGSMDGVKAQNELSAAWADAQVWLAQKLFPAIQMVFGWIRDNVLPIVRHLIHVFDEEGFAGVMKSLSGMLVLAWPMIRQALLDLATKLMEAGRALWEWIQPQIAPMLDELGKLASIVGIWLLEEGVPAFWEWIKEVTPPLLAELGKLALRIGEWIHTDATPFLLGKIHEWVVSFYSWIQDEVIPQIPGKLWALANAIGTWISDEAVPWLTAQAAQLGDAILSWLADMPGRISSAASGMWQGIVDAFKGAINGLIALWNNLSFTLGGGTYDPLGRFGPAITVPEFNFTTPNIPYLAAGGIVRRPMLAEVGHGPRGEAVVPLPAHGLGTTIVINVAGSVLTEGDLIRTVRNGLLREQRLSGISLGLT